MLSRTPFSFLFEGTKSPLGSRRGPIYSSALMVGRAYCRIATVGYSTIWDQRRFWSRVSAVACGGLGSSGNGFNFGRCRGILVWWPRSQHGLVLTEGVSSSTFTDGGGVRLGVTFNAAGMFSQAKSTRSLGESKCPSLKRRLPYKSSFPDQVGMASSISFTTSEFTSRSSSDPSSQAEGCRPSNRVGSRLEALSSSSVILTRSDVKAIKAVEVMKSCHDFDSTISTESLVLIRRRFSIPDEYALHAPQPGQRSYHENGEPQDDTQRDKAQRATEICCQSVDPSRCRLAVEAQALIDDLKVQLEEASQRRALLEIEVDNYHVDLVDSREQLKEVQADRRTLEDELLKMTSTMEKLKVELPAEAIAEYKKSTSFKMGLVRTGQVLYEYGYRVALARQGPIP
ncbi:hypothetical protein BHE74_00030958 [Ensete ventricosum]|nr:hypothetical protein BHE74_00030958 [Ensete ventricosum]